MKLHYSFYQIIITLYNSELLTQTRQHERVNELIGKKNRWLPKHFWTSQYCKRIDVEDGVPSSSDIEKIDLSIIIIRRLFRLDQQE